MAGKIPSKFLKVVKGPKQLITYKNTQYITIKVIKFLSIRSTNNPMIQSLTESIFDPILIITIKKNTRVSEMAHDTNILEDDANGVRGRQRNC